MIKKKVAVLKGLAVTAAAITAIKLPILNRYMLLVLSKTFRVYIV